jgi:hypothetical protein
LVTRKSRGQADANAIAKASEDCSRGAHLPTSYAPVHSGLIRERNGILEAVLSDRVLCAALSARRGQSHSRALAAEAALLTSIAVENYKLTIGKCGRFAGPIATDLERPFILQKRAPSKFSPKSASGRACSLIPGLRSSSPRNPCRVHGSLRVRAKPSA